MMRVFTDNLFTAIYIICEGIWFYYGGIIGDINLRKGRFYSKFYNHHPSFAVIFRPIIFSPQFASSFFPPRNRLFIENLFIAICIICSLTIRLVSRNMGWLFLMMIYSCHSKLHHHHIFSPIIFSPPFASSVRWQSDRCEGNWLDWRSSAGNARFSTKIIVMMLVTMMILMMIMMTMR